MRIPLLPLLALTLLASGLTAETFYVHATAGQDVPTGGTQAAPWKTIQYAVSQAYGSTSRAGNHVFLLARGTYRESISFPFPAAAGFTVAFVGSAADEVIVDGNISTPDTMMGLSVSKLTCRRVLCDTNAKGGYLTITACVVSELARHFTGMNYMAETAVLKVTQSDLGALEATFRGESSVSALISNSRIGTGGFSLQTYYPRSQFVEVSDVEVHGSVYLNLNKYERCVFRRSSLRSGVILKVSDAWHFSTRLELIDSIVTGGATRTGIDVSYPYTSYYAPVAIHLERSVTVGCGAGVVAVGVAPIEITVLDSMIVDNRGVAIDLQADAASATVMRSVIARNHGAALKTRAVTLNPRSPSQVTIRDSIIAQNERGVVVTSDAQKPGLLLVSGCTIVDNPTLAIDRGVLPVANVRVDHTILAGSTTSLAPTACPVSYCLSDNTTLTGTGNLRADPRGSRAAVSVTTACRACRPRLMRARPELPTRRTLRAMLDASRSGAAPPTRTSGPTS
ncbi:MAG: hypothetical protein KDC87_09350 [Planctomycetes bacterium]|nr:hypothetical protein [Planctomycetota bacterium]